MTPRRDSDWRERPALGMGTRLTTSLSVKAIAQETAIIGCAMAASDGARGMTPGHPLLRDDDDLRKVSAAMERLQVRGCRDQQEQAMVGILRLGEVSNSAPGRYCRSVKEVSLTPLNTCDVIRPAGKTKARRGAPSRGAHNRDTHNPHNASSRGSSWLAGVN